MSRMTGSDCAVVCNLINTRTHTHAHTHTHTTKERGMGTGTGVETRRRIQDGNGDASEDSSGDGNRDEDNGNEDRIGEGGREAKKRKKPQNSCRRHAVGNGENLDGKRGKCRKERLGPVAANPDNVDTYKEAGGRHKVNKNFISIESMSPLSRLIRGFRNKYN